MSDDTMVVEVIIGVDSNLFHPKNVREIDSMGVFLLITGLPKPPTRKNVKKEEMRRRTKARRR